MKNNDIVIRQITEKDIPHLEEFYKRMWKDVGVAKFSKRLEWIIKKNPFIPDNFGYPVWIAELEGMIVGHTAVLVIPFVFNGKEELASVCIDTIVDENYRGYGIGYKLNVARRKPNNLIMGIGIAPNHRNVYKKLGSTDGRQVFSLSYFRYIDKQAINRRVKSKFLSNVLAFVLKLKLANKKLEKRSIDSLQFEQVNYFDERFDNIWEKVKSKYDLAAKRTSTYLNWKYAEVPDLDYKRYIIKDKNGNNIGVLVYRKGSQEEDNVIIVSELFFVDFDEKYFISALQKVIGSEKNFSSINLYTADEFILNVAKRNGFKTVYTQKPMYYYADDVSTDFEKLKTYISRGESDIDQVGLVHQPYLKQLIQAK